MPLFNNVSGITYNMVTSFIGINATVNNISAMMYNMAQFYWCLMTLSTMC
ncbi:hypothetical protein [uncultured Gammaproteobacteria bacterium]|nr:hypothetical protein [uncultured Gammaproteobacteria bacterium]